METIMSACNYINQHYQEALSLEEVAEFSGFSKFHFTRIFKQCMNLTFYEYLNQKRISKAEKYVLGIASVGDSKEGMDRLCKAIEYIDTQVETVPEKTEKNASYAKMKAFMTISQAMDAHQKRFYLEESVGKISGEFAYLYPPGIPVIVPGEQITGQFVRNMRRYMEQGLELQGLSDSSNETICAVIDSPVKE